MAFRRICVCAALIFFFSTNTLAQVVSDFSTDADGWTAPDALAGSFNYSAIGGNPDGYITGQTPISFTGGSGVTWIPFYYEAPVKFEGDKSSYYGGNLRYDVTQQFTGAGISFAQITMTNAAGVGIYYFPDPPVEAPAFGTWTNLNVVLSADVGFWRTGNSTTAPLATQTDIENILANVDRLQVIGLYTNANSPSRIDNVTLYPPIIIDAQPDSYFVCDNQVVTFTTSASNNANITYHWQLLDNVNGSWNDLTDGGGYSGAATNSFVVNTNGLFGGGTYRARISGTAVDDAHTFNAILNVAPRPAAPTTTGAESCDAASLTLTAAGGTAGLYRWYDVETGGTEIDGATSDTYVTPELKVTTNYYAVTLLVTGNTVCESARTLAVAHIGPPDPPTATGAKSCTPAALILTAEGGGSGQYRWYTQATGGSSAASQHSKTFLTPTLDSTATYYVSIDNGLCESKRTAVTATIGGIDCEPDPSTLVMEIFNAVSPNKDGKNDLFFIRNIDTIADTKKNHVTIFNRWGDMVWEGNDYNNGNVAFTGLSKNNTELPSGTYYYKIEFTSGKRSETGYISLKR